MCGLFGGISTSLNTNELQNIGDLGIVSQLRGRDSSGVATFKWGKKRRVLSNILKSNINSSDLMNDREVLRDMFGSDKPFCVIGHCRQATVGDVSEDNAHPFLAGDVVGAHNGTISNIRGKVDGGTDSEALFKIINDEGVQAAVDAAKHGAYALTWVDQRRQTLNLLRNRERTLYYMVGRGVFYWASEACFLKLIADRDSLSGLPHSLEPDTLLELDLYNPITQQKRRKVEPKVTTYYGRPADMSVLSAYGTRTFEPMTAAEVVAAEIEAKKKREEDAAKAVGPSVPITTYKKSKLFFKGYRGKHMHLEKAKDLLSQGCAFCRINSLAEEEDNSYWFNNKQYLCKKCGNSTDARCYLNAKEVFKGGLVIEGGACGHC